MLNNSKFHKENPHMIVTTSKEEQKWGTEGDYFEGVSVIFEVEIYSWLSCWAPFGALR